MYKQVIVANKELNMSPGKLAAMVAHGSISFLCQWLRRNVATDVSSFTEYVIKPTARIDRELFTQWISGSFTKIILEVENTEEMKKIIEKAHTYGFVNTVDFFNIVDESTEFMDIPQWAVIAFAPMEAERIDPITGDLTLYGHEKDAFKINVECATNNTEEMSEEEFEKNLDKVLDAMGKSFRDMTEDKHASSEILQRNRNQ